jgi:23S rRNA pseudouridine955/2504/2580 synthase
MRSIRPDLRYLELVHRLDRETSGCLILAKRRSSLVALHEALREGGIDKRYRTLLKGRWRGGGRRIDRALSRHSGRSGERMVRVVGELLRNVR